MTLLPAILLGIVKGATEFVRVSSTGHLILVGYWLGIGGQRAATFEIFIQLGAVLAIAWCYRAMLAASALGWRREPAARRLLVTLLVAFLPAAVVGLVAHRWITAHLFNPRTVSVALILGGVGILAVERLASRRTAQPPGNDIDGLSVRTALGIGLAQVLSLIPGVSRSGTTIMGGLGLGLSRPAATEFSFLLALPVWCWPKGSRDGGDRHEIEAPTSPTAPTTRPDTSGFRHPRSMLDAPAVPARFDHRAEGSVASTARIASSCVEATGTSSVSSPRCGACTWSSTYVNWPCGTNAVAASRTFGMYVVMLPYRAHCPTRRREGTGSSTTSSHSRCVTATAPSGAISRRIPPTTAGHCADIHRTSPGSK